MVLRRFVYLGRNAYRFWHVFRNGDVAMLFINFKQNVVRRGVVLHAIYVFCLEVILETENTMVKVAADNS